MYMIHDGWCMCWYMNIIFFNDSFSPILTHPPAPPPANFSSSLISYFPVQRFIGLHAAVIMLKLFMIFKLPPLLKPQRVPWFGNGRCSVCKMLGILIVSCKSYSGQICYFQSRCVSIFLAPIVFSEYDPI